MKKIKTYNYKYKYIRDQIDYVFKNADEDDMINIRIQRESENSFMVNLVNSNTGETYEYYDGGELSYYLKGLGKFFTIADICSIMKNGDVINIEDEADLKYGISKIRTMNNDFLIIGGYYNESMLLDIEGLNDKIVTNVVIEALIKYYSRYGFCNFKNMWVLMSDSIGSRLDSGYFAKPYIYIAN